MSLPATPWIASMTLCLLGLAACGGGGGVGGDVPNEPPQVRVDEPAVATDTVRGAAVLITYADTDPDDEATTDLLADEDGDPETTADQIFIEIGRSERDGQPQTLRWDTTGVAPGTYTILARTTDGQNDPVTATSSATVRVRNVAFAKQLGGTNGDTAAGIGALPDGSSVLTGGFFGTAVFGAGETRETSITSLGPSTSDMYIARFNPDGTLARRQGGLGREGPRALATFPDGSFLVTGSTQGTAVYGAGDANQTTLTSAGGDDVFVARFHADGSLAFARRAGGVSTDIGKRLAAFPDRSFILTGSFQREAVFGPGEANETTVTAAGNAHFVARYDGGGRLISVFAVEGLGFNSDVCVAPLEGGAFVAAGTFLGSVTFGAGEPNETTLTAVHAHDVFIARYDANDRLVYARPIGGNLSEESHDVQSFADGSFVVSGMLQGTATFGPGESNETTLETPSSEFDLFLARYSSAGRLEWAQRAGPIGLFESRLAAFEDGGVAVTARISERNAVFGIGGEREVEVTPAGDDVLLARYAASGRLLWVRTDGGRFDARGTAVSAFPDGSVAAAGLFKDTATFGAGDARETQLTAVGVRNNIFVARYNADGGF